MKISQKNIAQLLDQIHQCTLCRAHLPFEPKPVVALAATARILIIGQAPGIKAHESAKPFNDASGDRLRSWLGITEDQFYNTSNVALMPMGFCFPGYKNGADAPPRKECAPAWHSKILEIIQPNVCILVGRYAQQYYMPQFKNLTEAVKQQSLTGKFWVLPHPSGRNNRWLTQNPWFEKQVLPALKAQIAPFI